MLNVKSVLILVVLSFFLAACSSPVVCQVTTVSISPEEQRVEARESFTITVLVDPAVPIAGAQFDLTFDPSVIKVIRVREGNLFSGGGQSTYFKQPTIMNDNGRVVGVACVVLGPNSVSSSGSLAIIEARAENVEGISEITLENVKVVNQNGMSVQVTTRGGRVHVSAGPGEGVPSNRMLIIAIGIAVMIVLAVAIIIVILKTRKVRPKWEI